MSAPLLVVKSFRFWLVKLFKISLVVSVFVSSSYLTFTFLNSHFFRDRLLPNFYFVVRPERLPKETFEGWPISLAEVKGRVRLELADYEKNESRTFWADADLPMRPVTESTYSAAVGNQIATPAKIKNLKLGEKIKVTYVKAPLGVRVLSIEVFSASSGATLIYGKVSLVGDKSFSLSALGKTYQVIIKDKVTLGSKYKVASVSGESIFLPGETNDVDDLKFLKEGNLVNVFYSRTEKDLIVADRIMILE